MTQFTLLDRIQDYGAMRSLWSPNATERAAAATFLRLGDQLEAQWKSNDIQGRLCGIALRTNDMLADMCSSLADLTASQEHTNDLLAKSLAVQTDHYMLEKRERVLKDALFRWTDILATADGRSDPHWVLIASRTLLAFLNTWNFTTEDLQDANEKRSFLGLSKCAKANIKEMQPEVVAEVNVFQALYADYQRMLDPQLVAEIAVNASPSVEDISAVTEQTVGAKYEGTVMAMVSENPTSSTCPPKEKQLAFVDWLADRVASTGERPVLAMYGAANLSKDYISTFRPRGQISKTAHAFVLLTDRAIHEYWTESWFMADPISKVECFSRRITSYLTNRCPTLSSLDGVPFDPEILHWVEPLKRAASVFAECWHNSYEMHKSRLARQYAAEVGGCVNAYLALHPGVEDFYSKAVQ